MKEIAYYDGKFGLPGELTIPLEERGFLFGEAVYEMKAAYNHIIWGLEDHLDRLERSLKLMEMQMPLSRAALIALQQQALDMVEGDDLSIYLQITRGAYPRGHANCDKNKSVLTMIVRPFPVDPKIYRDGGQAIVVEDIRWGHCDIKTDNLIPNAMAAIWAKEKGVDFAILERDGMVTEGAAYNMAMVKDGVLFTAPLSNQILHGVTRKHIVDKLAPELGIKLIERSFSVAEMLDADEVFICGSFEYVTGVTAIDGKVIGNGKPGPITKQLYFAYEDYMEQTCGKRSNRIYPDDRA
ncbi:MAG: aminotransferase class IV [Clostridiales bacterium]